MLEGSKGLPLLPDGKGAVGTWGDEIRGAKRVTKPRRLNLVPDNSVEAEAERFAKLTREIRVNGKPLESVKLRLDAERAQCPLRAIKVMG
jgi:hypothetical protein